MADVFTEILVQAQVPSGALGTIYTVPADTGIIAKAIILVNTSATPQSGRLTLKVGSTETVIFPFTLNAQWSRAVLNDIPLPEGTIIRGITTTSSVLDFTLIGAERTSV